MTILTKELIFNTILTIGAGHFVTDQLAESEKFTLFAEDVADRLVMEQEGKDA